MPKSTLTASSAPRKTRSARKHPTPEEIQIRAYEIFLERNGAPGNPLEDWVRAERELTQKYSAKSRKRAPVLKIVAA
jgi:Protein of unknown function (DUF2934)